MAEGASNALAPARAGPVFETGAASLYLPAFHKLAARVGLVSTDPKMVGDAGTAPVVASDFCF